MKPNSTVVLTFLLLIGMVTAGIFSAIAGMSLGRDALKGITQPDTRPTNTLGKPQKASAPQSALVLLKEEEILAKVKARMSSMTGDRKPVTSNKPITATAATQPGQFPLVNQSQGVVLEVGSVRKQGESMIFNVSLRNTGKQSVQFLYSLLDLTDDRGQALNASTEGLPSELPALSKTYSGTISVPLAILDGVKTVSLNLTDYPDQQLKLEITGIPVTQ